jgi:large subunit ribosomal protein L28
VRIKIAIIEKKRNRNPIHIKKIDDLFQAIETLADYYSSFFSDCFDFYKFIQTFALHFEKPSTMSRVCELTGKKMIVGNTVSHSNIKTKRRFYPNLQTKRFFIPEEDKWITLKVSTSALRTINKKGISICLKEAREKGFLINK